MSRSRCRLHRLADQRACEAVHPAARDGEAHSLRKAGVQSCHRASRRDSGRRGLRQGIYGGHAASEDAELRRREGKAGRARTRTSLLWRLLPIFFPLAGLSREHCVRGARRSPKCFSPGELFDASDRARGIFPEYVTFHDLGARGREDRS